MRTGRFPQTKDGKYFLNLELTIWINNWSHISPRLPKVNPIPQKKANSTKSLHPDGIELNTTLIR